MNVPLVKTPPADDDRHANDVLVVLFTFLLLLCFLFASGFMDENVGRS